MTNAISEQFRNLVSNGSGLASIVMTSGQCRAIGAGRFLSVFDKIKHPRLRQTSPRQSDLPVLPSMLTATPMLIQSGSPAAMAREHTPAFEQAVEGLSQQAGFSVRPVTAAYGKD